VYCESVTAALPPPLPPFTAEPQSLEQAIDEQIDLFAKVDFLKTQNAQLAARQDNMQRRLEIIDGATSRSLDAVTRWDLVLQNIDERTKKTHALLEKFINEKTVKP
jgi:hypothetical protein